MDEEIVKKALDASMSEWVKRLGQQHFSVRGKSTTACGMPMLGNNYARRLEADEKKLCSKCAEYINALELATK